MKKILVILLFLLVSVNSLYAFDIIDSDQNQRTYFSLSDSELIVISDSNNLELIVSYSFNSTQKSTIYNFTTCDSRYCVSLDLLDLFTTNTQSTSIPNEFIFKVGAEQRSIYLDVQKPLVAIVSESINSEDNTLDVEFNYSDNSNSIQKIELHILKDSNFIFEKLLSSTGFSYTLDNQEEIIYKILVVDQAENIAEIESTLEVGDIYEPEIEKLVYTLKENSYEVEIDVRDENLALYSFTQDSISLQEEISGTKYTKTLILPFTKGEVVFEVEDDNGNIFTQTLTLKDTISISSMSRYSNEEEYSFTSNADVCYLTEVDNKNDDSKFSKSGTTFRVDVDVPKFEDIEINFYCEKAGFRKYVQEEFYYDTSSPDEIQLSVIANEKGEIYLNWTESEDEHLDVTYIVYRDSDEIYEGSKTKYTDDDVDFPDEYEYVVRVEDLAGNYEESDEIEITPLKTDIDFFVTTTNNQVVQDSLFTIKGVVEDNTNVNVEVTNKENLIDTKNFKGTASERFSIQVILQEGLNSIILEVTDILGNTEKIYIYVTYESLPEIVQKTTELIESNLNTFEKNSIEPVAIIQQKEVTEIKEEVIVDQSPSYWLWLLLFLLVIIIFMYIVFTRENVIRKKFGSKSKGLLYNYSKSRKDDLILGKNLEKAKKKRIQKQEEVKNKKRKLEELKHKKEDNEYQKQKLQELSEKKEVKFSEFDRKKAERRVNKIKKESSYEDELEKIKEQKENVPFFKRIFSKKKEELKKDEFSEYVQKQKSRQEWNDTYSYRSSHVEKLKAAENAKIKAIEEEKKLKELHIKEEQTKQQITQQRKQKEQEHLERKTSADEFINKSKEKRVDLEDYLGKRTKKKRWFMAEKEVERDLKSRK